MMNTLNTSAPLLSGAFNTNLGSATGIQAFAGPRDDPFFLDLEAAFCILPDRRPASGSLAAPCALPTVGFRAPGQAVNYIAGYNVLSIVVELPSSMLENGAPELDQWLLETAFASVARGNATVFVATQGGRRVVGYYALAAASVTNDPRVVPGAVRRNAPSPIPCLLLARLAVDRSMQGRNLGRRLFQDALWRTARVADDIGFRALLIHARDDEARAFYLRMTASFKESPSDSRHLYLPTKEITRLIQDTP